MDTNSPHHRKALVRFELIAELLAENLDKGQRSRLIKVASEKADVSIRTIQRWVAAYQQNGINGLMPQSRLPRPSSIPDIIVDYAVNLRREVPERSVSDIIRLMELEHRIQKGEIKRSTLQDALEKRGFGRRQLNHYSGGSLGASRRFERQHRNELWQADIKYLLVLPAADGKPKRQIYASAFIDDATRLVTGLRVYEHQKVHCVLDCLKGAVERFGIPNELYVDNGKQYCSNALRQVCANLGIRLMHAKPYAAASKGKIEAFNKYLDKFVAEAKAANLKTLEEIQHALDRWMELWYQTKPHSAFKGKCSPERAFKNDPKPLRYADAPTLAESFTISEERCVDKTGCLSFRSRTWDVGPEYIGFKVKVHCSSYAPDSIIVSHELFEDKEVHPVKITSYCRGRRQPQPQVEVTRSRVLDIAEQHYAECYQAQGATCFTDLNADSSASTEVLSPEETHTTEEEK